MTSKLAIAILRRIVTLPRSDHVARVSRHDFYLPESSILVRVRRDVSKAVLASQFLRDLIENLLEAARPIHKKCGAACLVRKLPQCSRVASAAPSVPSEETTRAV